MKTHPILTGGLLAASLAVAGWAADPTSTPVPPAASVDQAATPASSANAPVIATRADPFAEMSALLDRCTFDNQLGLTDADARMDRIIAARVAAWKQAGHDVSIESAQKLQSATADFSEKLRLMTLATPESWPTAKHNTMMALQTLHDAYVENTSVPKAS